MPLMERRASVVWQGDLRGGSGRLNVDSGAYPETEVTFAARTEAADGKTSPEELIAAAHATCYAMVLSNLLGQQGTPPERLEVSAVCALERGESGLVITTMDLHVRAKVGGVDAAQFQEIAAKGEQGCPVSNALRNNVDIRVHAELA
jgi:lipoyl-dependent peroxiredoxin